MSLLHTPYLLSRRRVALGTASIATTLVGTRGNFGASAQGLPLVPTPRQSTGPYYPLDWSGDVDNDLVRVRGAEAAAQGIVTHVRGRVVASTGEPIAGATVEIWQADVNGLYRHPRDQRGVRDAGFQGRGRMVVGSDGRFAFRTIKPVHYPGRTPHIHVLVSAAGWPEPFVTQLYVAGEPQNERDSLFNSVRDLRQREAMLMHFAPADRIEQGALLTERDLVMF
ncbi:dioxygenase family protein [Sabulicella rubraurantiaca]|uniref:dioxygenase family protein n=1 Tax=Sabulicella rubraurantiaca TaxID=2811429 RepID=UPI001A9575D1|nr:hypothetical protein [Sabulicella rubraurantiaca]